MHPVDTVECEPCPAGGDCTGSTFSPQQLTIDSSISSSALASDASIVVQQRHIAAQAGYWTPPDSDGLTFYRCPRPSSCLPGENGTRSVCAEGYEGVMCTVCSPGYFSQYGVCQQCECGVTGSGAAGALYALGRPSVTLLVRVWCCFGWQARLLPAACPLSRRWPSRRSC